MAQTVKNPRAMQETWVWSLGWEDHWRRTWQPTSIFLPGESPWTEEPGGLQSMGLQRIGHDWMTKHSAWFTCYACKYQNIPFIMPTLFPIIVSWVPCSKYVRLWSMSCGMYEYHSSGIHSHCCFLKGFSSYFDWLLCPDGFSLLLFIPPSSIELSVIHQHFLFAFAPVAL